MLMVPIVIAHLGVEGYGLWAIIMAMVAYMRFGSAGIKSAFQKYVAEATGSGDFDKTNKLLSTGTVAISLLSILGLVPVALFSTSLARAIKVPVHFLVSTSDAISCLAVITILSNIGAVYEAIIMGGHRIDLVRQFSIVRVVVECLVIILCLYMGYGLFSMAVVMAISEFGYIACCYVASARILPQIRINKNYVTRTVIPELIRFVGSYQLVNVLEFIYVAILPVTILKLFGAQASGVYAICDRLVGAALLFQSALLPPLISGGSMVFALGSEERRRLLVHKTFKATFALTLPPLVFLSAFGTTIIMAWTGQSDPSFPSALWLLCTAGFFQAFSLVGLVLYRTAGGTLMDIVRQSIRILTILFIIILGKQWAYLSLLTGLAVAEFLGMIFMLFAVAKFTSFSAKTLIVDTLKIASIVINILVLSMIVENLIEPVGTNARFTAVLKLGGVTLTALVALWPALFLTKYMSTAEVRVMLNVFTRHR